MASSVSHVNMFCQEKAKHLRIKKNNILSSSLAELKDLNG